MAGQLPPITSSIKTRNVEPYYNYKPLQDKCIRLLKIEPMSLDVQDSAAAIEQDIHVTIEEHSLHACPVYIALSYTWGNAAVTADPTFTIFTSVPRCYPIYCEGRLLRGTRNLLDALRRLRQNEHSRSLPTHSQSKVVKGAIGNTQRYWIDALCVDQDDIPERSEQVRYMGRIFRRARSCLVYLGEEDEHSLLGLNVARALFENKIIAKYVDGKETARTRDVIVYWIESLSTAAKDALVVLLARPYFMRLWTSQEVVMAQMVVGTLGSLTFDFSLLLYLGHVLSLIGTDVAVVNLHKFVGRNPQSRLENLERPQTYQAAENLGALCSASVTLEKGGVLGFLDLIPLAHSCGTTDDRDRIYGLLAISAELHCEDEPTIPINYYLPVDKVYANATAVICLRQDDLGIFPLVGEISSKKYKALPSWCPDYSKPRPLIRNVEDSSGWQVGYDWKHPPNLAFLDNRLLIVSGFRFDALGGTVTAGNGGLDVRLQAVSPTELLDLVLKLSHGTSQSPNVKSRTTRVELLWRLLFTDKFANQNPAPPVTAVFLPEVILRMFLAHIDKTQTGSGLEGPSVAGELDALERVVKEFCRLEPESSYFLPDIPRLRAMIAKVGLPTVQYRLLDSIFGRAQASGLLAELQELLPSMSGSPKLAPDDITPLARFVLREILGRVSIRLDVSSYFSTAQRGRLGIGYSSIEVGDEVWLLNGHSAPVILRHLPNGNYLFLGESYIQGMMNGELVEELKVVDYPIERIQIE